MPDSRRSYRRRYDRRRSRGPLRVALLALLAVIVLSVAARSALVLFLLLVASGVLVWHRSRRTARPVRGRAESAEVTRMRAQLDQADAELEDAHRQVAELEQDAARHDQLVSDLEDAAGRPIEAIIASYRHVQRQYGPAAVGKTRRAR